MYYRTYEDVTRSAGFSTLDFAAHDEDRFFLADTGSHFSQRGWVFANLAADLFWHGHSISEIRLALDHLGAISPPEPLPEPSPFYCKPA